MKIIKSLLVSALVAMSLIPANAQVISSFNEATFFKAKFRKDKVWDVQRQPSFPVVGRDWTLSGLKDAMDGKGGKIDWGNDRYLMMVAEVDNSNSINSLTDDVLNTKKKYNISLQLFESNGTLVKVIFKWGKIAGIGEKGFVYEGEGRYGTFFSVAAVPSSTVIKYKPSLAIINKMSEIVNSSDLIKSLEKSNGITDCAFFNAKYTKENVWDTQRSPAYPVAGKGWTLSGLKGALESTGMSIDWGTDRYLMLVPEVDNTNNVNSLVDDINNSGTKLNISLKLFESDGRLVKVVSKWGKMYGRGDKGFMYEEEGHYGTFFSVALVSTSTIINYTPSLAVVTKLSELVNNSDLSKSLEKSNNVKECIFFNARYVKENVWDVQRSPAYPIAEKEWVLSGLKGAVDNTGSSIDWGTGRYLMLVAEVDNTNNANSIIDDINNSGTKLNISLKLFESDGRLVKVVSNWGKLYGRGNKGFMYEEEGHYGTFFSVAQVNSSTIINYSPSLATITKLSELVNISDLSKNLEVEKKKNLRFYLNQKKQKQLE